jgi:exportin-5
LREQWIQPAWQEKNLSSPGSLVQLLSQDLSNPQSHEEIWSMYHTITFFERALRRCTNPGKASSAPEQNVDMDAAAAHSGVNAMLLHLAWMVPPLLKVIGLLFGFLLYCCDCDNILSADLENHKLLIFCIMYACFSMLIVTVFVQLLRCMHALWSPSVLMSLPPRVKGALEMGEAEQAALLGELATARGASGASAMGDSRSDFGSTVEENGVKEIRTWLKGVRDSGYVLAIWSCCIRGAPEHGFVCSSAFLYPMHVVHKQALFVLVIAVVNACGW